MRTLATLDGWRHPRPLSHAIGCNRLSADPTVHSHAVGIRCCPDWRREPGLSRASLPQNGVTSEGPWSLRTRSACAVVSHCKWWCIAALVTPLGLSLATYGRGHWMSRPSGKAPGLRATPWPHCPGAGC